MALSFMSITSSTCEYIHTSQGVPVATKCNMGKVAVLNYSDGGIRYMITEGVLFCFERLCLGDFRENGFEQIDQLNITEFYCHKILTQSEKNKAWVKDKQESNSPGFPTLAATSAHTYLLVRHIWDVRAAITRDIWLLPPKGSHPVHQKTW